MSTSTFFQKCMSTWTFFKPIGFENILKCMSTSTYIFIFKPIGKDFKMYVHVDILFSNPSDFKTHWHLKIFENVCPRGPFFKPMGFSKMYVHIDLFSKCMSTWTFFKNVCRRGHTFSFSSPLAKYFHTHRIFKNVCPRRHTF